MSKSIEDFRAFLVIEPEVACALSEGRPVVALESTIISHGMPYPQNYNTAKEVEQVARDNGAVPATIAILGGKLCVGLNDESLKKLALLGHKARKCSRRDLAVAVAENGDGATTVAATMFIAHLAGIKVFVTGGIGGVHRGVEETMDISADLTEFGRTPVAVICAGAKSILDIPRTLEFLETQGVTVVSLGVDQFPAFFTRNSGVPTPLRLNTTEECGKLVAANNKLQLQSGVVIAVPIPLEQEADSVMIVQATDKALKELEAKGIKGREVTPYLLARVNELTGGESLKSNIALVKNNCKVGSEIAKHLSLLMTPTGYRSLEGARVVVVGGANADIIGQPKPGSNFRDSGAHKHPHASIIRHWGGVGRNIAEAIARLGTPVTLVTALGNDDTGAALRQHLRSVGVNAGSLIIANSEYRTSTWLALMDEQGDLFTSMSEMDICNCIVPDRIERQQLLTASMVVLDANIPQHTFEWIVNVCNEKSVPVFFESTSKAKCRIGLSSWLVGRLAFIKPSEAELWALAKTLGADPSTSSVEQALMLLFSKVKAADPKTCQVLTIILTQGKEGATVARWAPSWGPPATSAKVYKFKSIPATNIVNTSGAGDTLAGATVHALLQLSGTGWTDEQVKRAVQFGMQASLVTIASEANVGDLGRLVSKL